MLHQEVEVADYPRRVNFVAGQVLSTADLQTEQDYHRSMRQLQNRLHGHGVIHGLEVSTGEDGIAISPGVAIDAQGRELVLAEPRPVALDPQSHLQESDILLVWAETPERAIPSPDGEELITAWIERPEEMVVPPDQGPADVVRLARIAFRDQGGVRIDRSVCSRHPLSEQQSTGPDC
jgi:hypothetical protein